jgi:hypothetical protein
VPRLPRLDDARIARAGHRFRAELGGQEHAVAVDPADAGLGFRDDEAAGDEGFVRQVEFAHHMGVAAAARQRDQGAVAARFQLDAAGPDPVFVFLARQCIQVEHGFPGGFRLAVLVQRGAAPDAALMAGVAPEVVVEVAVAADPGNPFLRIEDGLQARTQRRVIGARRQFGFAVVIAFANPAERAFGGDLFQPAVAIVGGCVLDCVLHGASFVHGLPPW